MSDDWADQQRERLGESQRQIDELKASLVARSPKVPSRETERSRPLTIETLSKRRRWIAFALIFVNLSALMTGIDEWIKKPRDIWVILDKEQVERYQSADGQTSYKVTIPLNKHSNELWFYIKDPIQTLGIAAINLVGVFAILNAYRKEAKLVGEAVNLGPAMERPDG